MSEKRDLTPPGTAAAHRTEYPDEGLTTPDGRAASGKPDKLGATAQEKHTYEDPNRI